MVHHADYTNFSNSSSSSSKRETLQQVLDAYTALETPYLISNLSNCASLLWHAYHSLGINVNWSGFYIDHQYQISNVKIGNDHNSIETEGTSSTPKLLILGPFHGKVACQSIQWGKGVCGTAASTAETQVVPNIDEFPGHIACDGETKSEIVVPIKVNMPESVEKTLSSVVVGVIDLDCLDLNGFDDIDKEYLEQLAKLLSKSF